MANEEEEFLRAGFVHYPKAARTVKRFREKIFARIDGGLSRHWPSGEKRGHYEDLGEAPSLEGSRHVKLKDTDEATVSLGVGWEGGESYLYAYCPEGPPWAVRPNGAGFERDGRYSFLSHACDPANIERDIEALLNDFDRALEPPSRESVLSGGG